MRAAFRFLLLACAVGLSAGYAFADQSTRAWTPPAEERVRVVQRADARWQRLFPQGQIRAHAEGRELIAFALDAAATGGDADRIRQALEMLRAMQDTDPASKTYGNMRWYTDDARVVDRNGVEFIVRHAAVLWLQYRDWLTPEQRAPLVAMLELARTGITRHAVAVSYTNIFLMKAWNLIALGEGLDDAPLVAQGQQMLRDWLAYTSRNGISEYLSPTYNAVNLENLSLIRNLSRDPLSRQLADAGLDAIWSDVALHWYAPAGRLGGSHSRDYNRLFNTGDINVLAGRAGWPAADFGAIQPGPYAYFAWRAPSERVEQLRSLPLPRWIGARWGEGAQQRHWHYMAADYSVGSTESGYNTIDTAPLAINLGGGADAPVVTWAMDGRGDHYGTQKILETGSGHLKALHLRPFLASVQRGSEVLFVAAGREDGSSDRLESTLVLPANSQFWLDGKPLSVFAHRSAWRFEPAPDGQRTRMAVAQQNGRDVLVLDDGDTGAGLGVARVFPVEQGREYRLRARIAGDAVTLYLNFYDAQGHLIGGERMQRAGGGAMADYAFAQRAPAGAVSCRAWLYSSIAARAHAVVSELAFERIEGEAVTVLGGFDFKVHQPQDIAIPAGATLVVQRGTAAAAFRLLGARDVDGREIGWHLHNDGLTNGAVRLTAQHATARRDGLGVLAMWAWVQGGLDERSAAEFRQRASAARSRFALTDDEIDANVQAVGAVASLHLKADVARGVRLVREGGDTLEEGAARSVNGQNTPY
ncbi:MAG: hypothetical protein QM803_08600 [Rhodocyclaceae bacterium]